VAVTIAAIVAGILVIAYLVAFAFAGGNIAAGAPFVVVLAIAAVGMWRGRYWAVLGFQMLLVIFLLAAIAGLVTATTVPQLIGTVVLVAVCITFFIFMVKAMARIQMPHRLPRD
jgi:dipeptide/tripeptide permease